MSSSAASDSAQLADGTHAVGLVLARLLAAVAISRIEENPALAISTLAREIRRATFASPGENWSPPFRERAFGRLDLELGAQATAAWFLGEIGPAAREVVPVLASRMKSGNDWMRTMAAQAIWKIHQDTNLALPPLVESLQNTKRGDMPFLLAATLLGQLGPAALPAVPHLREHRKRNWKTWRAANDALKQIQGPTAKRPQNGDRR